MACMSLLPPSGIFLPDSTLLCIPTDDTQNWCSYCQWSHPSFHTVMQLNHTPTPASTQPSLYSCYPCFPFAAFITSVPLWLLFFDCTLIHGNVRNYSPDTVSHPRKHEGSATQWQELQISWILSPLFL